MPNVVGFFLIILSICILFLFFYRNIVLNGLTSGMETMPAQVHTVIKVQRGTNAKYILKKNYKINSKNLFKNILLFSCCPLCVYAVRMTFFLLLRQIYPYHWGTLFIPLT